MVCELSMLDCGMEGAVTALQTLRQLWHGRGGHVSHSLCLILDIQIRMRNSFLVRQP